MRVSPPADYMMKLAAQKFIELKSEHFGKGSMSVFGGEFIKRLFLKADPPSDALAPIAEVDEAASADATASEIASNADALSSADVAALQAGIRAAAETEAPASKPQPKEPSAKKTAPAPRWASDTANTQLHVVWLNIVSDDTNQNWYKVRTRTLDRYGSHACSAGICAGGARYLRHAINVQARQPKHHQVLHLAGRCRQLAQRRPARNSS